MIPVVITKMPNTNYVLVSFDPTQKEWFKSEPFPGNVKTVLSTVWSYGPSHLALVEMNDGSQHVYRTPDYGQRWVDVWTPPSKIYAMKQMDFGMVLASAENGWYRTVRQGLEWTKISSQAISCDDWCQIGKDILLAHDGRYIWRSANGAVDWSKVYDCGANVYPAIAGYYSRVYVGGGTDLIMSDDFGLNFAGEYAWNIAYRPWLPNWSSNMIKKILLTRVDGKTIKECKFFLQTHDLSDNTLKHFVKRYEEGYGYRGWTSKFTQPYNISDGLDAYQVYVPGTTNQTFMLISSQTKAQSGGGYTISFKKAIDGGDVWVDVDLSTAKIFSTDLSKYEIGGAFLEDSYAELAWVGPACHNYGYWLRSDKWEMNLSFDVAANMLKARKKEFNVNCNVKKIRTKTFQNDALLQATKQASWQSNGLFKKTLETGLLMGTPVMATKSNAINMDAIVVFNRTKVFDMDVLAQKAIEHKFIMNMPVQDTFAKGFSMSTNMVKSYFELLFLLFEKYIMQELDIRPENWSTDAWGKDRSEFE